MMKLSAVLMLALAATQVTEFRQARFGSVGQTVTDTELVQINGLADKPAWLVLGFRSMIRGEAHISVYLQPDVVGPDVQRGRVLRLVADDQPTVLNRSQWRVRDTHPYAYIAAPGRPPRQISSEHDIGWPFGVQGDFDDETLISIVAFIRSKPALLWQPEGHLPRHVREAPIAGITRRGDVVIVGLRTSEFTTERYTLARTDGQWLVTDFEMVIV